MEGSGEARHQPAVPQWKRDLLQRRAARTTCPPPSASTATDMLLVQQTNPYLNQHLDKASTASECEELTYGPGIVKKLKSRYLSLTLREATIKSRPSIHGLRRAASLEHGLDDSCEEVQAPVQRKYEQRSQVRPTRYRQPVRSAPDAVKRARSVDALVRCDSRSENEDLPDCLSPNGDGDSVFVEAYNKFLPVSPPPMPPASPDRVQRPKRPPPLLKDTERPPPDLVKTALKIFEGHPGKRSKPPALTGQVADKVKTFTEQVKTKNGRLQKPAIPPRGPLLSPDFRNSNCATQTTPSLLARPPQSPKKFILQKDSSSRERSVSPVYVNKHPVILSICETTPKSDLSKAVKALNELKSPEASPRNSLLKSPECSEKPTFIIERNGDNNENHVEDKTNNMRTSTPDPEIIEKPTVTEISLISPTTPFKPQIDSTRNYSDSSCSSEDEAVYEVNGEGGESTGIKIVSKASADNIAKAGVTTQYSFTNGTTNGDVAKKSYLPSAKSPSIPPRNVSNKTVPCDSIDETKSPDPPVRILSYTYPAADTDVSLTAPLTPLIIPKYTVTISEDSSVPSLTTAIAKMQSKPQISPSKLKETPKKNAIDSSPALVIQSSPIIPPREGAIQNSPAIPSREGINSNLKDKTPIKTNKTTNSMKESPKSQISPVSPPNRDILSTSGLTSREIEKNLINTSKSLEQPVKKVTVSVIDPSEDRLKPVEVVTSRIEESVGKKTSGVIVKDVIEKSDDAVSLVSEVVGASDVGGSCSGVVVNGVSSRPQGRKPHWQQQNTMVFNFSDRKNVPDYVENDGVILKSSKRDKPRVGADVLTLGDSLSGESCTDSGDVDDWTAEWTDGPPSPCDVAFENDNVLINGRSNIAFSSGPKSKSLKIQFDDTLTQTFEYPSEASMGEELANSLTSAGSPTISPLASGGPLSSYTPSKMPLQTDAYQLGVTRTSNGQNNGDALIQATNGNLISLSGDSCSTSEESTKSIIGEEDYLKPCEEADSHNWSHDNHIGAGDLLF